MSDKPDPVADVLLVREQDFPSEDDAPQPDPASRELREALDKVLWEGTAYWRFANPEKGHHDLHKFAADLADEVAAPRSEDAAPLPNGAFHRNWCARVNARGMNAECNCVAAPQPDPASLTCPHGAEWDGTIWTRVQPDPASHRPARLSVPDQAAAIVDGLPDPASRELRDALADVRKALSDRQQDMSWCNKTDNCHDGAEWFTLALDDFDHAVAALARPAPPALTVERIADWLCSTFDLESHDHEAFLQPDHCEQGLRDATSLLASPALTVEVLPITTELAHDLRAAGWSEDVISRLRLAALASEPGR